MIILLYNTYVTIIYPLVHNRYKVDLVVCASSYWERRSMRTIVKNVGKLSDFFSVEEKAGGGIEYTTSLEGKQIKLSKKLMDELESGWHFLYPREVTIKVGNRPTRLVLWRHKGKEGFISRIVFTINPGWGKKSTGGVIWGCTPQSNKETVVITSME